MKKLIIFLLIIFVTGALFATETIKGKNETSGVGLEFSYGNPFTAGIEITGKYYIKTKSPISISISAGIKHLPSIPTELIGIETEEYIGTVFGGQLYYGNKHRVVLEATYGDIKVEMETSYNLHGDIILIQEKIVGTSFCIGYQYMGDKGFILTLLAGSSEVASENFGELHIGVIKVSVGYKF